MITLRGVWVPVGSFVLALLLAALSGSSNSRAFARRAADPTAPGDQCVSDLKNLRGRIWCRSVELDLLSPHLSRGHITARYLFNYEGGALVAGNPIKTLNIIRSELEMKFTFLKSIVPGTVVDVQDFTVNLPLLTPALGSHQFIHDGIQIHQDLEVLSRERGSDLARLLALRVKRYEDRFGGHYTPTADLNSRFAFQLHMDSSTIPPPFQPPFTACKTDSLGLKLQVLQIDGFGSAAGVNPD